MNQELNDTLDTINRILDLSEKKNSQNLRDALDKQDAIVENWKDKYRKDVEELRTNSVNIHYDLLSLIDDPTDKRIAKLRAKYDYYPTTKTV